MLSVLATAAVGRALSPPCCDPQAKKGSEAALKRFKPQTPLGKLRHLLMVTSCLTRMEKSLYRAHDF